MYFATIIIKISKAGFQVTVVYNHFIVYNIFNELSQLLAFNHAFIIYPVSSKHREEWALEGREYKTWVDFTVFKRFTAIQDSSCEREHCMQPTCSILLGTGTKVTGKEVTHCKCQVSHQILHRPHASY